MRQPLNRHDRRPPMKSRRHVDVLLVDPQKSENIGGAARAIANMGLGRLVLVRPRGLNRALMEATATSHAAWVLEQMHITRDFDEALSPYELVIGTTARVGNRRGPFYTPRQLAPEILCPADDGSPIKTALLFGAERMGLSTDDLRRCQKVVRIPTEDPMSSSLNLAQSVLLFGYELIIAAGGEIESPKVKTAPFQELDEMYDDLTDTLVQIGFLPEKNSTHWLMNIKKIFNRSGLTSGECNLWRGICRQIRWAAENNSHKLTKTD